MLVIACRYLTGRIVAASDAMRDEFQYPPDPARLFMALTAAAYEGHAGDDEFELLRWLETLPPPTIEAPKIFEREIKTVFVPVNDRAAEPWNRAKQPRFFPSAYIGDQVLRFVWPETNVDPQGEAALHRLLSRVVRLGHSSSLVQLWLAQDVTESESPAVSGAMDCYLPSNRGELRMRVPSSGTLTMLDRSYNGPAVERYADLSLQIDAAEQAKDRKLAKRLVTERDAAFPTGPPQTRSPIIRTTCRYVRRADQVVQEAMTTDFDPVIVPLSQIDGNVFHVLQTLDLTRTLRQTLLSHVGDDAPSWLSGHGDSGDPTRQTHVAFVPLPHVASSIRRQQYDPQSRQLSRPPGGDFRGTRVDGHLLGLGLVIPRAIDESDRADRLAGFLVDSDGEAKPIQLYGSDQNNDGFELTLQMETRTSPPKSLTAETWTAASRTWATVTPIVLDRHPKADLRKDRAAWREEVAQIIAASCVHVGLSRPPISIDVGRHGFLAGVPSAHRQKQDRAGGFALMSSDDGKPHRLQVHALLEFDSAVVGPLILGAGRFRGYGFCKPVEIENTSFASRVTRSDDARRSNSGGSR